MSKGFKGFIIGLFVLGITFVLTVLTMSSVHKTTFIDEIKSWGNTEKQEVIQDDENQPASQFQVDFERNEIIVK